MPVRTTKAVAVFLDRVHVGLPPRIAAEPFGPLVPVCAARDLVALLPLPLRVLGDVEGRDAADSVAQISVRSFM